LPGSRTDGTPGSDQRRQVCWDRSVKGSQQVPVAKTHDQRKQGRQRGQRQHHWIARSSCVSPRGYRSPIRLEGGSRFRLSDPHIVRFSQGQCGYESPAPLPVDNDETRPWDPDASTASGSLVMFLKHLLTKTRKLLKTRTTTRELHNKRKQKHSQIKCITKTGTK